MGVCERDSYRTMSTTKQTCCVAYASYEALIHMLETLPDALFVVDDSDTIIYANARAQAIAEATEEEVCGMSLWRCAPQLVSTSLYQAVQRAKQVREPITVEYASPVTNSRLHVSLSPTEVGLALFFHEHLEPLPLQDALSRDEQMYRNLLEGFSDGVTILTPDGLVLDINQRPLADASIRREDVVGKLFTDLPAWSYDAGVQQQVRTAIARASRGETVRFEARIHPRAGLYLDVLMTITAHRDANQQVEYLICAGRDITERKQTEDALRILVDAIPHFVWIMHPDGAAAYANRRWCDYTGKTLEQLQGDGWLQLMHPDDRQRVQETWETAVRTGTLYEVEHRILCGSTGNYRWFLARGIPYQDTQGQILYWLGTCTDIDEQKRAEQRLRASEEALRQSQARINLLMNSSIIGTFVSEDERVVEANETYLRMTGYTREDLLAGSISWLRMTPPEYAAQTQQERQELMVPPHVTLYEKEYICKDGSRLPVVVGAVALRLDPLQVIGFVLDNSARKELEQRKDAFISMASHELRNPLTILKLQSAILQRQLGRQGIQAPALSSMEVQINTIIRLVEELLDVSKIQAGRLEYRQETVDLDALLREITDTMQQTHPSHRILLHGAVQASLPGDRERLGQVFTNLLSNAIKYSPDAQTVDMELSASPETVTICVRDHGLGIPREQRDKIFERFYRATGPRQREIPGLGMGLYIVAEIVKRHGGTITVDSEIGKGSTFTVTLPRKRET